VLKEGELIKQKLEIVLSHADLRKRIKNTFYLQIVLTFPRIYLNLNK